MCALGTESSLWNERDGNLFWLTKVLSVHQARKKKKVGHGREHFFIKKGDWYVNLIYYKQIHPDTQLHFRVGQRGLTLCESLLIYPRTGDILDISSIQTPYNYIMKRVITPNQIQIYYHTKTPFQNNTIVYM
mgnify:CR=1 FL=1